MARSQLVVKAHKPWRARVAIGLSTVTLLAGSVALYEYGRHRGGFNRVAASEQRAELLTRIAELEQVNGQLRADVALMEASRDVDREAYRVVDQSLAELQGDLQRQREELAFYQEIVSPADGRSGLEVHNFRVRPEESRGGYQLDMVLIRKKKHDRRVRGVVELTVKGTRAGQTRTYALADIAADRSNSAIEFGFRYFQELQRHIRLPEGFEPASVDLRVVPSSKGVKPVVRSFEWTLTSG